MRQTGIARTYNRLIETVRRWAPETAHVLLGGLRVTLAVEICALILWCAATPFRAETYELWRSAQAMCALIPATLIITLAGGAAVEKAARKMGQNK